MHLLGRGGHKGRGGAVKVKVKSKYSLEKYGQKRTEKYVSNFVYEHSLEICANSVN